MSGSTDYDLLIVGGGPAGATLGTLVKKYDPAARVLLIEKAEFPRHHIGESLLPAIKPVLREMGVLETVEAAGFPKKMGSTYIWGQDRKPWNGDFTRLSLEEFIERHGDLPPDTPYAWQVLRSRYDEILLDRARASGVEVLLGAAEGILEEGGRVVGATVSAGGRRREIRSALLADCSGQSGFLSKFRPIREVDPRLKNVAAYAYFRGAPWRSRFVGHPEKTRIFVCSVDGGWIWYIPIAEDVVSVGVVTTHAHLVKNGVKNLRAHFTAALARCPEVAELLKPARIIENFDGTGKDFFTVSDWSYLCREAAGDGWLAAGDAAVFVDPIFSSGVTIAHLTAQRAACTIATVRKGATKAVEREMWKDYSAYCCETASRFLVMALYWYGGDRSQQALWEEAKRIYQARLPEPISGLQAYVAVVSGSLLAADSLMGFNLDDPEQEDFYHFIWKRDAEFEKLLQRSPPDEHVPRLLHPFALELAFFPETGSGLLKKALRMKILKHDAKDPLADVFNPKMALTTLRLEAVRQIDGRRSLGEIKARLAASTGAGEERVAREFQVLIRQLDVWKAVDVAPAGGQATAVSPSSP